MQRATFCFLMLLASSLAVPFGAAADTTVDDVVVKHEDGTLVIAPVQIVNNSEVLSVVATTSDNATGVVAVLRMDCGAADCPEVRRQMVGSGGDPENDVAHTTWTGAFPVDDPQIVVGEWTLTIQAHDASGLVAVLVADDPVEFVSSDAADPVITLVGGGIHADIGASEDVRIAVNDSTLQKVTYLIEGMAQPGLLPAPYVLNGDAFAEGNQDLTIRAYDRSGQDATLDLTVRKDTAAPHVETVLPEAIYAHVPFELDLVITDSSGYDVQVSLAGEVHRATGLPGTSSHGFTLLTNATGNVSLAIHLIDELDNLRFITESFNVSAPRSDATVEDVRIVDMELPPLSGQTITFEASLGQDGDAAIPVHLEWAFDGQMPSNATVALPAEGGANHSFQHVFSAGNHVLATAITIPDYVNATDDTNRSHALDFEVFMGRVTHGTDNYHLRAGAAGLPSEAVGPDGTVYPVRFDEQSETTRYVFEVDGKQLHWDPLQQVTVIQTDADPEETTQTPGLGLPLVALALLGAALVARRR